MTPMIDPKDVLAMKLALGLVTQHEVDHDSQPEPQVVDKRQRRFRRRAKHVLAPVPVVTVALTVRKKDENGVPYGLPLPFTLSCDGSDPAAALEAAKQSLDELNLEPWAILSTEQGVRRHD